MFVLSTWHRMVASFGGPKHINTAADCGIVRMCSNPYASLAWLLSLTVNTMLIVFSRVLSLVSQRLSWNCKCQPVRFPRIVSQPVPLSCHI